MACFATVLVLGLAIGSGLLPSSFPPIVHELPDARIARVQFAPDRRNRCEQFEWNNSATPLRSTGISTCRDASLLPEPPEADGPQRRMSGISSYFKKR